MEKKKYTAAQIAGGVIGGLAVGAMLSMPMWFIGSGDGQGNGQTGTQSSVENADDIVIADDSYVTATFEEAYEAPGVEGVFYVSLNVQNKTNKTIWVYLDKASVNKETVSMVSTGVPLNIAPGNSGRTGFIFPMSQLSINKLSDVRNVTFDLVIADEATLEEFDRAKGISLDF
nr:MAG TPA: Integrin alpha-IIb, Integrin beta-3, transmembrane signaling, protein structure [Caudoviricetes sp.]